MTKWLGHCYQYRRSTHPKVFYKKGVLKNCVLPPVCNVIKKVTVAQCFPEILRNFQEHLFYRASQVAASANNDSLSSILTYQVPYQVPFYGRLKPSTQFLFNRKALRNNVFFCINSVQKQPSEACNFIKKETPTQLFSYEFCEIFKNTIFIEHLRWLFLTSVALRHVNPSIKARGS